MESVIAQKKKKQTLTGSTNEPKFGFVFLKKKTQKVPEKAKR